MSSNRKHNKYMMREKARGKTEGHVVILLFAVTLKLKSSTLTINRAWQWSDHFLRRWTISVDWKLR